MIDSQNIHDALNLLPDDLITPVEILRQKKPFPWKSLTALAACLCLCVGLWCFFPGAAAEKNSASGTDLRGNADGALNDAYFSESGSGIQTAELKVYSVGTDHITVVPTREPPENYCVQIAVTTVTFEKLDEVPTLEPGQHIRIYFTEYDEALKVSPHRIEIIND